MIPSSEAKQNKQNTPSTRWHLTVACSITTKTVPEYNSCSYWFLGDLNLSTGIHYFTYIPIHGFCTVQHAWPAHTALSTDLQESSYRHIHFHWELNLIASACNHTLSPPTTSILAGIIFSSFHWYFEVVCYLNNGATQVHRTRLLFFRV